MIETDNIPGYKLLEKVSGNKDISVFKGIEESSGKECIVKVINSGPLSREEIEKLNYQYEIIRKLSHPGIIGIIDYKTVYQNIVFVLEYFNGITLKEYIKNGIPSVTQFLAIALKITAIVDFLHKNNIVHKDLKPQNFLINPLSGELKLISFGNLSSAARMHRESFSESMTCDYLAYISPEQTGRMNLPVDYRTDFYSLGIIFYEMLTGELPFRSADPVEIIHCHIAKKPSEPCRINPELPQSISEIIMKLLSKNIEDRYISANGIKNDLEICLNNAGTPETLDNFIAGEADFSDKLQISGRFYGRENELKIIWQAYKNISKGKFEIAVISGPSGVGKTTLINKFQKSLFAEKNYFICGKFEKFKRNVPYSSLIQAFQQLIKIILTESRHNIEKLAETIISELGDNVKVIANILPELNLIIKDIPPEVYEFDPKEAEIRFKTAFQKFIEIFASKEHPLILFLDNLHWADIASLKLIRSLVEETNFSYFLLITSYIEGLNPEFEKHFAEIVSREAAKGVNVRSIKLFNLSRESINQLLSDSFFVNPEKTEALADLVYFKTGGNPFFVKEFLKSLYEKKLIHFYVNSGWYWNVNEINKMQITENVIDLMTDKFYMFPAETQELLKISACIGNRFAFNILTLVSGKTPEQTYSELYEALKSGMILIMEDHYKFLHDKVHETIYSLISNEDRKKFHYKIGRLLLNNINEEEFEDNLFEIVNHLNSAINLITKQEERNNLAQLNLLAGKKAKLATAYSLALRYFKLGIALLLQDDWQDDNEHALAFSLHLESAECNYLITLFDESEKEFDFLLVNCRDLSERTKVFERKIILYITMNRFRLAIETGAQALELYGITLPLKTNHVKLEILKELINVRKEFRKTEVEELLNLPSMTDAEQLNIMKLLINVAPAAYLSDTEMMILIILKMINLSLKYGNSQVTSYAYASYAMLLCTIFKAPEQGYRLGRVALELNEKFNNPVLRCKINFIFGAMISHWRSFDHTDITMLTNNFKFAVDAGDLLYSGYTINHLLIKLFTYGENLESLNSIARSYSHFMMNTKNPVILDAFLLRLQTIQNLKGLTDDRFSLSDQNFDENRFFENIVKKGKLSTLSYAYMVKLQLYYLFGDYDSALTTALTLKKYLKGAIGTILIPEFYFYYSLTLLALYSGETYLNRLKFMNRVKSNQRKMKKWLENCPEIFFNRYELVNAGLQTIKGNFSEAEKAYHEAAKSARENGFLQNEALANELLARFYFAVENTSKGQAHITEAYNCYIKWGAKSKVNQLIDEFRHLSKKTVDYDERDFSAASSGSSDFMIDFSTVMKASQALSEEIFPEKLINKLLKIVVENAGAQRGLLLLKNNDELYIVAEEAVESEGAVFNDAIKLENSRHVSQSIVHYVERTLKDVVINDAGIEGIFTVDPYIQANKPKSVLCIPITKQASLIGILYLENNLTEGAFTEDRIQVLKVLASQAAISLENARLYDEMRELNLALEEHKNNLEYMVKERTKQLEETQKKMVDIAHSAGMAEISTGVLHNIGNILNSVNISSQVISDTVENSKLNGLFKANAMLSENMGRIEDFLLKNPKGKKLLNYYLSIGKILKKEKHVVEKELKDLSDKITMIKEVIATQQNYAKTNYIYEKVKLENIVEDALYIKRTALEKSEIKIEKSYSDVPPVEIQKTKLINVLLNLIKNSKEAMQNIKPENRIIKLEIKNDDRFAYIIISDNGEGIPPENIFKIFKHGFSTKKEGHGFGLHFCANSMTEMGGKISARSDGPGKGSEFMLALPLTRIS